MDGTVRKSVGEFVQALHRHLAYLLSLHVSEILPLLFSSTPLFPTLHLVSSTFPIDVPLGVGGWPLSYKERIWSRSTIIGDI